MMDAVEFLDKVDRLSKRGSPEEKMRYNAYRVAGDNTGAVEYVEQLDDMHPIKTRQSEFLKLFPNAQTDSGCLNACPMDVFGNTGIDCNKRTCFECKKEFWLAEVEDA